MRAGRTPIVLVAAALAAGCSASGAAHVAAPASAAPTHHHADAPVGGPVAGKVVVVADDSLRAAFTVLAGKFEEAYPGTSVDLQFGASAAQAGRVAAGAGADLFASAGMPAAQQLITAGRAQGDPHLIARDSLVIAVRDTGVVRNLADLAQPKVRVALCSPRSRCGTATRQVLESASLDVHPVTVEADAKAALARVTSGSADAALVYRTDVPAAPPGVRILDSDAAARNADVYPVIAVATGHNAAGAQAFIGMVTSALGRSVLNQAGFGPP
jgi:molybdate transport system substrate-binding protein